MANELGQPTAQEIAEKFCTEMLCNALLCDGCPVQAILHAAQHRVQWTASQAPRIVTITGEDGKPEKIAVL